MYIILFSLIYSNFQDMKPHQWQPHFNPTNTHLFYDCTPLDIEETEKPKYVLVMTQMITIQILLRRTMSSQY